MMDDATKVAVLQMMLAKTREQRNDALDLVAGLRVDLEIAQQQLKALAGPTKPDDAAEPVSAKPNGSAEHVTA